jgi:hypothetical protein
MSLALLQLTIVAAVVAQAPAHAMPAKQLPRYGQESAPQTKPAKGGTFIVKSSSGAAIATVSIKGGNGGNPATIAVTLQPAKAGAAPAAENAAAQVVSVCVPGASTQFTFGPFVNGRTTKVVSYIEFQQIGSGEGFLVTNNGVSGCTKLPSTMMSQAPSKQSTSVPRGSYGNNCTSAHMQGKILVASCLGGPTFAGTAAGDPTTQSQINPAKCAGRDIVESHGKLACGPPGSKPPAY